MKKILFPLFLVMASATALAESTDEAKVDKGPGVRAGLQTELGITTKQQQEMRKIRHAGGTREEMDAVLTPEQREGVKELRKSKDFDFEKTLEKLQSRVDLTDEQVAEMKVIAHKSGSRKAMLGLLTKEQRASLRKPRKQRKPAPAIEADSDSTSTSAPK